MSQLEYRFETLTLSITTLLWTVILIISIELIFGQTGLVAGWTKQQVLLVAATNSFFTALVWLMVLPSMLTFIEHIKKGSFDFYLLKPINIRFLLSVNKTNIHNLPVAIVSGFLMYKYFTALGISLSLINFLGFATTFLFGLVIFYNLFFFVITLAIWLVDMSNIEDLFSNFMDNGKYPVYIFQGILRSLFIFVVPTAFIATFPIQFLLGKGNPVIFIGGGLLAIASFYASQKFWNFALKHYSSASS